MLQSIFRNMPPVVKNLLIIILTVMMEYQGIRLSRILGIFYPGSQFFEPYQFVTHMFMHGGFPHLFFNMFGLLMFGAVLEKVWGPKKFLMFFLITGLGAALVHTGVQAYQFHSLTGGFTIPLEVQNLRLTETGATWDWKGSYEAYVQFKQMAQSDQDTITSLLLSPAVGASGALFGILIAFAMLFPNTELMLIFLPIPIKAKYFIPVYIIIELYLGVNNFAWDNVAHYAHLGGALFGFILVKIWQKDRNNFY